MKRAGGGYGEECGRDALLVASDEDETLEGRSYCFVGVLEYGWDPWLYGIGYDIVQQMDLGFVFLRCLL